MNTPLNELKEPLKNSKVDMESAVAVEAESMTDTSVENQTMTPETKVAAGAEPVSTAEHIREQLAATEQNTTVIGEKAGRGDPVVIPTAQTVATASKPQDTPVKLEDIKGLAREEQIKVIKKVVYRQGLYKAIDLAKGLQDPYVADTLHDILVDELYQSLKQTK